MNHVMYADDICLLAPSAIGLQRLLDVCFDFNIRNDIMFNPIKSVCVVFKSKSNKLYCPTASLHCDILEYTADTKYLCFTFSMNAYIKSTFNKLRVPFNNAYRRVLGLPWRSSASAMYANFGIQNFEAVIRSLLLDLHNVWPKALILLLWLLKVHGLYVLIYGTSGKRHSTLLQQHEFFFFLFELMHFKNVLIIF